MIKKCKVCGEEFETSVSHYHEYCSDACEKKDFWTNVLNKDAIIIDHDCYHLGSGKSSFKGFYGRTFRIQMNDGRKIETSDLWHNGRVPDEYYTGDNARFI